MGNYLSCTLAPAGGARGGAARVIFPTGETKKFDSPVNAAELMLGVPNHFLADTAAMQIGRRFSALAADEDLEMGGVYAMLPMRRLSSVVTPGDMGGLLMAAANRSPVMAMPEETKVAPEGRLGEVEGMEEMELRYRISKCRSRKPNLETIAEENTVICSR